MNKSCSTPRREVAPLIPKNRAGGSGSKMLDVGRGRGREGFNSAMVSGERRRAESFA
jgi:hypothetical protein